jgi:amino-acid N-acetyltransferase
MIRRMSYIAERARPEDLEAALELLRRAGLPEQGVTKSFGHYLAVRDAARLVGLCGLEVHGDNALLRSVVVDAQYRGEGVGQALLDGVWDLARKVGAERLYLLTTTAHDYFARAGFRDVPRDEAPAGIRDSWEFKSGCPASSAFMCRDVPRA